MANNGEVLIFDILKELGKYKWEDDFGNLPKKQQEFIIGSLLGDGRLECRSLKRTARLRIHHADSEKDYLFWKYGLLREITIVVPKRNQYIDKRFKTNVVSWYFHTKTLPSLGRFHTLFYKNGKKVIPDNLQKLISPFSLAVLVMDDGCLYKHSLILNTQCFTAREEQLRIINILKKKFDVEVGLNKDRNNFRLYFQNNQRSYYWK